MTFPDRIAVASTNPHKLREIARICSGWPVAWITHDGRDDRWPVVDEPYESYVGNAVHKARAVSAALDVPTLADDSGLEVDALGGAPGPRSARFAGERASDAANLAKLIGAIAPIAADDRTARYRCVAALAWPGDRTVHAEGACEGTLVSHPRGERGFGYDPIFVPEGGDRTMAELGDDEKDRISHRGRALRELTRLLEA